MNFKKNIYKLGLFLLLGLFFASCLEVIDNYPFPAEKKVLVINSLFHEDSVFNVRVSSSYPAYDKDPLRYVYIEDAKIELFENDVYKEQLNWFYEGKYRSENFYPRTGNTYKVMVSAMGYDTVQAFSFIPEKVTVNIDSLYPVVLDQREYLACKLFIDDPPENNYYYFTAHSNPGYYDSKYGDFQNFYYFIDDKYMGKWSSDESDIPGIFVFPDMFFNGTNFSFNVFLSPLYNSVNPITVYFSLYTITEELYKYIQTLNNQVHVSASNLTDVTPVYNNIENGLGIFSGYSLCIDSFLFEGTGPDATLYYGKAVYNEDEYGLSRVKYNPDNDNGTFSLSIGTISVYLDSKTNKLKVKGINISINLASIEESQIVAATYTYNPSNVNTNSILSGKVQVSDTEGLHTLSSFQIEGGEINIAEYYYDPGYDSYIIDFVFNFVLNNNHTITGTYKGPVYNVN